MLKVEDWPSTLYAKSAMKKLQLQILKLTILDQLLTQMKDLSLGTELLSECSAIKNISKQSAKYVTKKKQRQRGRRMFNFMPLGAKLEIFHDNGTFCGDILSGDDGFYCWWPPYPSRGGCYPQYFMRIVYEKLKELNDPLEKQLEEYFERTG